MRIAWDGDGEVQRATFEYVCLSSYGEWSIGFGIRDAGYDVERRKWDMV